MVPERTNQSFVPLPEVGQMDVTASNYWTAVRDGLMNVHVDLFSTRRGAGLGLGSAGMPSISLPLRRGREV